MDLSELLAAEDAVGAFKAALDAREGVAEGRYCECDQPNLTGDVLMCGTCRLRNQDQEIRRVRRSVNTHPHVPGRHLGGRMCAVCTQFEDAPRHHGIPAVGRTSWGEAVRGV